MGRLRLYDWKLEFVGLIIIALIVFFFNAGAYRNKAIVESWLKAIQPVLDENFAQVGVKKDQLYVKDSAQLYTSYATGRINIRGLTSRFELINRPNYFYYLTELFMSYFFESVPVPQDTAEIEVKLFDTQKLGKYIFAIVNKEGMNNARQENYYLSLTKTTESSKLPLQFVFMSESADLNEGLATEELREALKKAGPVLKYLAVTDLPSTHPNSEEEFVSAPKIVAKLNLKSDSQSLVAIRELVAEIIALADRVSKFQLKSEQQKKINNVRTSELNKIKKALQEIAAEELREKKLEAEREARRASQLSPEEQDKLDQKMREKRERRARNRQKQRM